MRLCVNLFGGKRPKVVNICRVLIIKPMKLSVCEQHFHKKNRLSHKITIPLHDSIINCSSMEDFKSN